MRIVSWVALGAAALALGCASNAASSSPDAPHGATAGGPAPSATAGGPATATGMIQNYTRSPAGEVDGFVLTTGQRVHVPEGAGAKLSDQFPPNTPVQVIGHAQTGSDGRTVIEADQLTNPQSKATLDLTALRATPPSPAWGPSVGGAGTAGTQPANPPAESAPGTPGNPPPGGR
jgi:hypothetical protein